MTDSSIPDVPEFADALTPLERAKLGLQDELSVFEIGRVTYSKNDAYPDRERLTDFLLKAIKAGWLAAYGNPDGWTVIETQSPSLYRKTPYPRCDGHEGSTVPDYSQSGLHRFRDSFGASALFSDSRNYDRRPDPWTRRHTQYKGDWCLVTRADYLAFLALPEARGIPKPDGWKAPSGEPASSAPTLPQGEPDKPGSGAAGTQNPAMNRQCVSDKARFLKQAKWQGTQQATVNYHPEAGYFKGSYDIPTLLKWASEIDPRPKGRRGGRPRKS